MNFSRATDTLFTRYSQNDLNSAKKGVIILSRNVPGTTLPNIFNNNNPRSVIHISFGLCQQKENEKKKNEYSLCARIIHGRVEYGCE